jgi:Ca2+-binding EF-hand superfamily protein
LGRIWVIPSISESNATPDDQADHLQKLIRERFEIMTNFADLDRQSHELTKVFRKFDLDGSGCLNFDEFEKVLVEIKCNHARAGAQRALFDRYDDNLDGAVNLKELKDGVFNLKPHPLAKRENRAMLENIREQLAKRGTFGCRVVWSAVTTKSVLELPLPSFEPRTYMTLVLRLTTPQKQKLTTPPTSQ